MTNEAIIIFLKKPIKGKVKTRLAREVGDERALDIYLKLIGKMKEAVSALPYDVHLFYSELDVAENNAVNLEAAGIWQQEGVGIGERMFNALKKILGLGYGAAVLVGADIWGIKSQDFNDAFDLLKHKDVVFGPARDGGYYLVGFKNPYPDLFRLAAWSHERVLSDSLDICKRNNLSVGLIRKLKDIDYAADLEGTDL